MVINLRFKGQAGRARAWLLGLYPPLPSNTQVRVKVNTCVPIPEHIYVIAANRDHCEIIARTIANIGSQVEWAMLNQFWEHQECQIQTSSEQQLPQNKHPFHNSFPAFTASPLTSSIRPTPSLLFPSTLCPLSEQLLKPHFLWIIFANMRTLVNSPLPLLLYHETFKTTSDQDNAIFKTILPPHHPNVISEQQRASKGKKRKKIITIIY